MRGKVAAALAAALLIAGPAAMACDPGLDPAAGQVLPLAGAHDPVLLDAAVLGHVNRARCENGLSPLAADAGLRRAAAMHADDMGRLGFFDHVSPVPGRETMQDRIEAAGVGWSRIAENIISGHYVRYRSGETYQTIDAAACRFAYMDGTEMARHSYASMAGDLVGRWMASPGHRANILTPELTRHGFALAPNAETALCGGIYATQVMAG